jgi:3-oxoadipate enol-lactonase
VYKMQRTKVNGFQVAYTDIGAGDIVVLLHGFCSNSRIWRHIIPIISPHYRVIAPDFRGCGHSEASGKIYSMDQLANDIYRLLTKLGLRSVVLLGFSAGGYVTLAFAEKHPAMLKAFGLMHSTGLSEYKQNITDRHAGIIEIPESGIASYIKNLSPKLFTKKNLLTIAKNTIKLFHIGLLFSPMAAIHFLHGILERPDRSHVIREAKIPVLLLAGHDDQIIPTPQSFTVHGNHISHDQLQKVGHFSMLEDPKQLADAILRFLDKVYLA